MELKVIGAGLPRTGTLSLQRALQILLNAKCYHTIDLLSVKNKKDYPLWIKAINSDTKTKLSREEWATIFSNYSATVGLPSCYFFEELMHLNPDAKIILTLPQDGWAESMKRTIKVAYDTVVSFPGNIYIGFSPLKLLAEFGVALDKKTSFIKDFQEENGEELSPDKRHMDWIQKVSETVPKDKLLIYDIKSGWKPLCKFLNVPMPSESFPKSNGRENFEKILLLVKLASYVFILCVPLITAVLTIVYYKRAYK